MFPLKIFDFSKFWKIQKCQNPKIIQTSSGSISTVAEEFSKSQNTFAIFPPGPVFGRNLNWFNNSDSNQKLKFKRKKLKKYIHGGLLLFFGLNSSMCCSSSSPKSQSWSFWVRVFSGWFYFFYLNFNLFSLKIQNLNLKN